jgi:4-amino-4-deoxy-L-arabinose transferase-like glycosyltransferase
MQISKIVRQEWLLLTLLILVSLSSQLIFIRPVSLSDEMIYYRNAVNFPRLPQSPNHWSMRLGIVLPVGILYRIFGHSELVYYFLPISSTILLVASTYLIGCMLFSRLVGAAAALWFSFLPYFLLETGNLLPDITASACITTAIMLLIAARNETKNTDLRWICLLSGVLFGWAYLSKEYFAVFALIIPIIFWQFRIPRKYLLWVAFGISLMVAIEFGVHTIRYGSPLLRLTTSQPRETTGHIERDVIRIMGFFFIRLSRYRGIFSIFITVSGMAYLTIRSSRRSPTHLVLLTWVLMIYTFFTMLGLLPILLSWKGAVLLRLHIFRYWIPLLPPLAIGGVAALEFGLQFMFKKAFPKKTLPLIIPAMVLALIISAACVFNIFNVSKSTKFLRTESNHYQELRTYLTISNNTDTTIWIVRDLKIGYEYVLPIYAHTTFGKQIWNGQIKYLNTDGVFLKADEVCMGTVLIDRDNFNPDFYRIPRYLADIPENWQLVFESSNGQIAIYDVP